MSTTASLLCAIFAGLIAAGFFWASGATLEPGPKLGAAYLGTICAMVYAFYLARNAKIFDI